MKNDNVPPSDRTLEQDIPELKDHLYRGARVLDIGCGPGTIALDVAAAVYPGEVVGIDPLEERIAVAREWAEQTQHKGNITFEVGDSHKLEVPDDGFDILYSHTALHFFLDPIQALREQMRVVRKGGWVVASGLRDHVISPRYPACPNWDKVMQASYRFNESIHDDYVESRLGPVEYRKEQIARNKHYGYFYDFHAGRKCVEWFTEVGLRHLDVRVKAENVQYPGSRYMKPQVRDLLPVGKAKPESNYRQQMDINFGKMIEAGLIDESTLKLAIKEAEDWYGHPHAFNFWTLVFAAGMVG